MNTYSSPLLQDYYTREREVLKTEATLRASLLALGVSNIYADYDGVGDSGQIDTISYADAADRTLTTPVDTQTQQQVENLLYALLTLRHDGWENNDGGFGTFRWNLVTGALEHEHSDRYTEYEHSFHEGFGESMEQSL